MEKASKRRRSLRRCLCFEGALSLCRRARGHSNGLPTGARRAFLSSVGAEKRRGLPLQFLDPAPKRKARLEKRRAFFSFLLFFLFTHSNPPLFLFSTLLLSNTRKQQSLKQADVASNSGGSGGPLHNFNNNPPSSSSYSTSSRSSLPGAVDWRGGAGSAHGGAAGERAAARAALVSLAKAAEERYQPLDWALRPVLSLAFLPLLKGVPAPFTGVSALSD